VNDVTVNSGQFRPGNPGKPKGAKSKTTQLMEAIVTADPEALKEVAEKVVELARDGKPRACELIFNRLWPAPRGRLVQFEFPPLRPRRRGPGNSSGQRAPMSETQRLSAAISSLLWIR
jgi:hypothetical protein